MMLWHHYARVNSHQRWKQTRFRVCFHLWCELTITMNVAEWQVSWNSWKSFFGRKILDFKIFAPPLEGFAPPGNFPSYATALKYCHLPGGHPPHVPCQNGICFIIFLFAVQMAMQFVLWNINLRTTNRCTISIFHLYIYPYLLCYIILSVKSFIAYVSCFIVTTDSK